MVGMKHYNKMYRPLPTNLTIKKSKIEGLGLFTNNVIKKGVELTLKYEWYNVNN